MSRWLSVSRHVSSCSTLSSAQKSGPSPIPKGVPPEKVAVILDLMAYLLTPAAQAYTYDKGYFYPGPAVKGVTLAMAPKESQDVLKEYGRPEYDGWIAKFPHTQPLDSKAMVDAFRLWDQQVGTQKTK